MRIDDLLKTKQFKELDLFLTKEMVKYAGIELFQKMIEVLENETSAKNWFYSPLSSLDGKRPYDYCKEGKLSEVEKVLGRFEHGVYS